MKFQPVVVIALLFFSLQARAQTTLFTYQGNLSSGGGAANGNYDFRFRLFDVNTNLVAGPITNTAVAVTNGQFTTALNFGSEVFNGSDVWLEIAVRSNGTASPFIPLSPSQQITSVPYAIQSLNAANATALAVALPGTNISGTIPGANLPANVAFLNSNQTFTAADNFSGTVTANNPANVFSGAFAGNGGALTNVAATNLTGTLPDARLSVNVPLLNTNQIYSGSNTFSGVVSAMNAANNFAGTFSGTFSGNGTAIKNLTATNIIGTLPDTNLSVNVALQSNTVVNFAGTVSATNFVGAGHGLTNVPGAFFWVTVAGSNAQAFPNVGYICTNQVSAVTITSPPSPSVGDTFKIVGVGAGGWKVAQNAGQTILSGGLASGVGQSWKAVNIKTNWAGIACSSDGTEIAAVVHGGNIYTSADSGNTWTIRNGAPRTNWSGIASSSDGTKFFATVGRTPNNTGGSGYIYTSSDSGSSWSTSLTTVEDWTCIACSDDGSKQVAASYSGPIFFNSGSGWTQVANTSGSLGYYWNSVASSSDGSKLAAVGDGGYILISTNSGVNWTSPTNFSIFSVKLDSVAMSSDGTRMVAVGNGGQIYLSVNSGATWSQQNSPVVGQLAAVTSSADGSQLAAAVGPVGGAGNVYYSSDSSASWAQLTGSPSLSWTALTSSSDGSLLAGTVWGDFIYISSQASTTTGTSGYLVGAQHSAIELIYVGNGNFLPINHEGTIRAY